MFWNELSLYHISDFPTLYSKFICEAEENLTHFLLTCKCLECVRKPIIEDSCSKEIARFSYKETKFDILQLIVDPFVYIGNFKEEWYRI